MTVDHIGLSVRNLDAMTDWWSRVLDAQLEYSVERPAMQMRANVLIDADGFRLELLHRDGSEAAHPRWNIAESLLSRGFGHIALQVDNVDASFSRLLDMGAAGLMEPSAGSQPGMTIAFVADPEDNLIELLSRDA